MRAFIDAELAAGRFTPACDAWLTGWDEGFTKRLAAKGWLGLTVPREYGGAGRPASERYVVVEELLKAGAPVAAHWIADRQVVPTLLRFGTEHQRQTYLPAICAGECYFAIGMSEPDTGSDLAGLRTRAHRIDGGWQVSGSKVWTSGAHRASAFIALVRTAAVNPDGRHAGLSQLLIDLRADGVTVRPIVSMSGAHHFNEVILDEVFVPDDMLVGTPGDGWRQVTAELAYERSGPERFLSTFPLLEEALRVTRRTGCDDTSRAALGELVMRLTSLRWMSLAVARRMDADEAPDILAAMVKDAGTRYESQVIEVVRRLVGNDAGGRLAELLSQSIVQAPGFTLRGGTNEILRGVIARELGLR